MDILGELGIGSEPESDDDDDVSLPSILGAGMGDSDGENSEPAEEENAPAASVASLSSHGRSADGPARALAEEFVTCQAFPTTTDEPTTPSAAEDRQSLLSDRMPGPIDEALPMIAVEESATRSVNLAVAAEKVASPKMAAKHAVVRGKLQSAKSQESSDHLALESRSETTDPTEEESQHDVPSAAKPQDLSNLEEFVQLWRGRSTLSLQDYSLTSLEPLGLGSFPLLTKLCLAGNEFTDAAELTRSLSGTHSLTDLDLSRCRLRKLPELQKLKHLCRLNASNNALRSSSGLLYCTELRSVFLCHNQIRRMEQLETLQHLEELHVSHNKLGPTALAAFRTVSANTQLRILNVAGNPLATINGHQVQLMNLIPSLELIDGKRMQTLRARRRGSASNAATSAPGIRSSPSSPSKPSRHRHAGDGRTASPARCQQHGTASAVTYGLLASMTPDRKDAARAKPRYGSITRSRAAHIAESPRSPAWASRWNSPANRRSDGSPVRAVRRCLSASTFTPTRAPQGKSARRGWQAFGDHPDLRTRLVTQPKQPTSPSRVHSPARSIISQQSGYEALRLQDGCPRDAAGCNVENESHVDVSTLDSLMEDVASSSEQAEACTAQLSTGLRSASSTLDKLLEEKRRLLKRVSAHLGSARLTTGSDLADASIASGAGGDHAAMADSQALQGTPTLTAARDDAAETGHVKAYVEAASGQGHPSLDLKSLRSTLRDGIERKRLLLEQLRCI